MRVERYLIAPCSWDNLAGTIYEAEWPSNPCHEPRPPRAVRLLETLEYITDHGRIPDQKPKVVNLILYRLAFDDSEIELLANDPDSYLWGDDPDDFATWLTAHGVTATQFAQSTEQWFQKSEEFIQFKQAVAAVLPEEV